MAFNHPKINVIVELTDDPEFALELTLQALKKGKHVVSANKKMIANNLEALLKNQNATGKSLLSYVFKV